MILQNECKSCWIKRASLSLVVCVLLAGGVCAQERTEVFLESYVGLDTAIMIASSNVSYSPKVASCSWGESVYVTDYCTASGDTVDVYKIDTRTFGLESQRFVVEGLSSLAMAQNYRGMDFLACNDSLCVMAMGRHLYVVPVGAPERQRQIVLENSYDGGKFNKHGDLVLYRYYYGNRVPTELSVYSMKKQSIVKTVHPEGGNMLASYIGGIHVFDVGEEMVVFGRPNEFEVDVYDLSLKKVGCIAFADGKRVIGEGLWKAAQALPRHEASKRIDMFSPLEHDLMLWTYVSGDDIVAVYRSRDSEERYSLHAHASVFRQGVGTTWRRVVSDAVDRMWKGRDEVITRYTVPVDWVGGNEVLFTKDKIVSITTKGTLGAPVGMTMREYEGSKIEWLRVAGYRMQVNIFSFNF